MTTFAVAYNELLDSGKKTPCSGSDLWLSDNPVSRSEAAERCGSCTLQAACYTMAEDRDERFGVWGGQDFTVRPGALVDELLTRKEKQRISDLFDEGQGAVNIARVLEIPRSRVRTYIETLPAYQARYGNVREQSYDQDVVKFREMGASFRIIALNIGITERQANLAWKRHKTRAQRMGVPA